MNFVFLVDRYETWHIEKDTSYALMAGAQKAGHHVSRFFPGDAYIENGHVFIQVEQVTITADPEQPFVLNQTVLLDEETIACLFIRTDPPFDQTYLMQTWILDQLPKHIPIINKPSGIRSCNEKIWAAQFSRWMPATCISQKKEALLHFADQHPVLIAKPTNGFGGQGIIKFGQEHALDHLSKITKEFTKDIILQQYVPEAEQGDKRILLLNGEPLGAVLRVHGAHDFRNNFMAGGKAQKTSITAHEKKLIEHLKPYLEQEGLYFVGIDLLGPYLTEINVTSPTCLKEINHFEKKQLEIDVIGFAEKLIETQKI